MTGVLKKFSPDELLELLAQATDEADGTIFETPRDDNRSRGWSFCMLLAGSNAVTLLDNEDVHIAAATMPPG